MRVKTIIAKDTIRVLRKLKKKLTAWKREAQNAQKKVGADVTAIGWRGEICGLSIAISEVDGAIDKLKNGGTQ